MSDESDISNNKKIVTDHKKVARIQLRINQVFKDYLDNNLGQQNIVNRSKFIKHLIEDYLDAVKEIPIHKTNAKNETTIDIRIDDELLNSLDDFLMSRGIVNRTAFIQNLLMILFDMKARGLNFVDTFRNF